VVLTFDEKEPPIRHYYKRHFVNGKKRVISCQIDPHAFVKVRNYDGSRAHTSRDSGIAWKFNRKVSRAA